MEREQETLLEEQQMIETRYVLSSVFPSKEINDIVKNIIHEQNKISICQSLGLSEEGAKLLTWNQVNEMLENRKQNNNRPKIFERLRQTRRRVS